MSFPTDPLGMTVEMAPGADLTAAPATWTWVDISQYVRVTDDIDCSRGKMSALSDTVPASLSLKVDNTGGRFTPRNPTGRWYGSLQRNTPIRLRVDPGSGVVTRMVGYVPRWPPRWDPSGNNQWVSLTAYGVMRRLSTAGKAGRSALHRYLSEQQSFGRIAYWPCEDGPDATEAATADDQTGNLTPSAPVRFGSAAPLSGVSTMLNPSGAYLHATMPRFLAYDWRVECVVSYGEVPTATVRALTWTTVGTLVRWDVSCGTSGIVFAGYLATGVLSVNIATGFIPQPSRLHHIRCDITRVVNDLQARIYIDGTQRGSTTTVVTAATLPPTYLRVNPDAASADLPLVGHIGVWSGNPVSDSADVALGMVGEQAHARIETVCAEQGVPVSPVYGGSVSSELLGPRPSESLMAVLRDAEATDGGLLYELVTGELSYLRRDALYNQTVALTLDYAAGEVQPPFLPAEDDQQLVNDVTARRSTGSESRYSDEDHVAAEGRYEAPLTVNPETDNRLQQMAAWAVHKGTTAEQRFDNLAISLSRSPSLISAWLACDIGSRIQVTNVPSHLSPDTVDLILVGYTETFTYPRGWRVDMVCEPASPWTIGVLEDTVLGRLDTAGSSLATANLSAKADSTSATANVITVADSSAVGFSVGNVCVLHDSAGYRKEPTTFTITAMASGFGFTNITFSPPAEEPPTGVFAGAGDTIRRVDQTSLSVATTTGPLWTTSGAEFPFDIDVGGEQMTVTAISGAASPQTFTVVRAVNGVRKGHAAGADVRLRYPLILGL